MQRRVPFDAFPIDIRVQTEKEFDDVEMALGD